MFAKKIVFFHMLYLLILAMLSAHVIADDVDVLFPQVSAEHESQSQTVLFIDSDLVDHNDETGQHNNTEWMRIREQLLQVINDGSRALDAINLGVFIGKIGVERDQWRLQQGRQVAPIESLKDPLHHQVVLEGIVALSQGVSQDAGQKDKQNNFTHAALDFNQLLAGYSDRSNCENSQLIIMLSADKLKSLNTLALNQQGWLVHFLALDSDSPFAPYVPYQIRENIGSPGLTQYLFDIEQLGSELTKLFQISFRDTQRIKDLDPIPSPFSMGVYQQQLLIPFLYPASTGFWPGNMKRLMLGDSQNLSWNQQDLWQKQAIFSIVPHPRHVVPSINRIEQGGFVERLPFRKVSKCHVSGRPLYTFTSDYQRPSARTGWATLPKILASAQLTQNKHCLTDSDRVKEKLLELSGISTTDDQTAMKAMIHSAIGFSNGRLPRTGALLHSKPTMVSYGARGDISGHRPPQIEDEITTLFFSTNQGFLHALDGSTGEELFSFMPQELLTHIPKLFANPNMSSTNSSHDPLLYGLDSTWVAWRHDAFSQTKEGVFARDGIIDRSRNEEDHVYLYGGMRRGGYQYYALDVTDVNVESANNSVGIDPKLKFLIQGGDHLREDNPYRQMGETWSVPTLAQVRFQDRIRTVIFFGGGYDPSRYDHPSEVGVDRLPKGNQIYMVDAESGQLLWWASAKNSGADLSIPWLTHSIPAQLKVLDVNGNGLTDRLYFGDLGGQVFRLDLNDEMDLDKPLLAKDFARLTLLATLGGEGAHDRRFFETPSVARFQLPGGETRLAIAIASGDRTSPKRQVVAENLFVLFDRTDSMSVAMGGDSVNSVTTLNDLSDITANQSMQRPKNHKQSHEGAVLGWRLPLATTGAASGEKSLGSPLFFQGYLIFTTYVPNVGAASQKSGQSCPLPEFQKGYSRLYVLEGFSGKASARFRGFADARMGSEGRYLNKWVAGVASDVHLMNDEGRIVLFSGGQSLTVGTGQQLEIPVSGKSVHRVGWQQVSD